MSTDRQAQAPSWTPVLDASDLADGDVRMVRVGGRPVVVVLRANTLHALAGICPHDLASLEEASVRGDELICPRHGACFRLSDGVCGTGFRLPPLRCYPVRLQGKRVEIDRAAVERNPPGVHVRQRWDLTRE